MPSGSPTSNRNAGGPGLDRQIVPGPSLILSKPRRCAYSLRRRAGDRFLGSALITHQDVNAV
jgi:hypothetical protein